MTWKKQSPQLSAGGLSFFENESQWQFIVLTEAYDNLSHWLAFLISIT
jgi:hypothetical protein